MNDNDMITYSMTEIKKHCTREDAWVSISGNVLNITDYLDDHPGGSAILLKNLGTDVTKKFNDVGHSTKALSYLNKYKIGGLKECAEDGVSVKDSIISLFFTHEDYMNLHKTFGLTVLLHYLYRFGRSIVNIFTNHNPVYDVGFSQSIISLFLILIHACLSWSSLFFKIPEIQNNTPMIWQEFRAHSIGFASRSIVSFIAIWLSLNHLISDTMRSMIQSFSVLSTLVAADQITKYLKKAKKETTTRTLPYWDGCPEWLERFFKSYYAYAQFMATMMCLQEMPFAPFCVMFPIQLAAFLMTCVKKGLISTKTYHIIYYLSLMTPNLIFGYIITFTEYSCSPGPYLRVAVVSFIATVLRMRYGVNKYNIWLPILTQYLTHNLLLSAMVSVALFTILDRDVVRIREFLYHKNQKKKVSVLSKKNVSHDTILLTFSYPGNRLGIEPGNHVRCHIQNPYIDRLKWNHEDNFETEDVIVRKYTPIAVRPGEFDLLVKVYDSGGSKYPDGGRVSQLINRLNPGDTMEISGPVGNHRLMGINRFLSFDTVKGFKKLCIVAGGTGITPMVRIIDHILENDSDNLVQGISILCSDKTQDDILMKQKLEAYGLLPRCNVWFTVTSGTVVPETIGSGTVVPATKMFNQRINSNMLRQVFDITSECTDNTLYLVCGPTGMCSSVKNDLESLNVNNNMILVF